LESSERRDSAKKKASDDARDSNSLVHRFTTNEEESSDAINGSLRSFVARCQTR
jgi:hypothetical protein